MNTRFLDEWAVFGCWRGDGLWKAERRGGMAGVECNGNRMNARFVDGWF